MQLTESPEQVRNGSASTAENHSGAANRTSDEPDNTASSRTTDRTVIAAVSTPGSSPVMKTQAFQT